MKKKVGLSWEGVFEKIKLMGYEEGVLGEGEGEVGIGDWG